MRNTHSHKAKDDARFWPKRMRDLAKGGTLDPRTSKRFAREFEQALTQRGAEAKKMFEESRECL